LLPFGSFLNIAGMFTKEKEMEYKEFLDAVCDYVNESDEGVNVSVHSAVKNNGVKLSGLSFSRKDRNASPTIYMENYYQDYKNGADICDIGDRLIFMYRENDLGVNLDMSFFDSFDTVKDRLYIKLINRNKNEEFLKEVPYEGFLDLAIVAYVRVNEKKIGNGLIMVRNEHLKLWGCDAKTVLNTARTNTHDHDDYSIKHIMDVLSASAYKYLSENEMSKDDLPMYVATNKNMINGAAVITMPDKLREYADVIGGDYYVIPSSVHEVILLGKVSKDGPYDMDGMIREINEAWLGPDDVLADHAYMYSKDDGVLIF